MWIFCQSIFTIKIQSDLTIFTSINRHREADQTNDLMSTVFNSI